MENFGSRVQQFVLLCCLWLIGCAVPISQPTTPLLLAPNDIPVIDDKLDPAWNNWSFRMTLYPDEKRVVHTGERSVGVSINDRNGAARLVRSADIYGTDYTALRIAIHGGVRGGQSLDLALIDSDDSWSNAVNILPVAQEWTVYEIPLVTFGRLDYLKGIVLQEVGGSRAKFYLDSVVLVGNKELAQVQEGPELSVDLRVKKHLISAEIYGISFADERFANEIGLPINRWGGNAVTRYNWQIDVTNRASDWYYLNVPNPLTGRLPDDSAANQFVKLNQRLGAETVMTIPMIGWTPKSRAETCGFAVKKYGGQQSIFDERCGNGLTKRGKPIENNDPSDTSRRIDEQYVVDWINHLIDQHGTAADGGVRYYALDNEPMLWNHTHRDVFPKPLTYDGLVERSIRYARAVKSADPTAQTLGPVLWGWNAYFYSALDSESGRWTNPPDRSAHDNLPLVQFYLQNMAAYEAETGQRLLDVFDLHYYPQSNGIPLGEAGGASVQEARLRSTRSLWDWEHRDESWIDEPVALIPRMHDWVNENYPNTRLAISEYNWGGLEHINGALAQADVLGIFGRERLDMAMLWDAPESTEPGAFAFRIYRNYDGEGGQFGDVSLAAASSNQDQLSIYAAERPADGARTVVVINKTRFDLESTLAFDGKTPDAMEIYRYSRAALRIIIREGEIPLTDGQVTTVFPAQSITLFVLPAP